MPPPRSITWPPLLASTRCLVIPEYGILKKWCKQNFTNQISLFYCVINRGFIL